MPTNYPTSLDTGATLPTTRADATAMATNHKNDHDNVAGAAIALETKVGIGANTPVSGTVLTGTGVGTSAWVAPSSTSSLIGSIATQIIPTAYMDNSPSNGNDDHTFLGGWNQMLGSDFRGVPAVIFTPGQTVVTAPVIQQYLTWRNQLRAAGIWVLGYIDLNINDGAATKKAIGSVQTEIDTWESLYKPDGIWTDNSGQAPVNISGGYLQSVKTYMLSHFLRNQTPIMVCNVGIYPDSTYASVVDIMSLESTYANWAAKVAGLWPVPAWAAALPKTRFATIVTNSALVSDVDTAFGTAEERHVGYVYVDTAAATFNRIPFHWNRSLMWASGRQQRFTYARNFPSPATSAIPMQIGPRITEPMTVTKISAYRAGGTGATLMVTRVRPGVGTDDLLGINFSVTTANAWMEVNDPNATPQYYQHTDLLPDDVLEFRPITTAGGVTELIIQIDGTNP